jgi:hypothetical protein
VRIERARGDDHRRMRFYMNIRINNIYIYIYICRKERERRGRPELEGRQVDREGGLMKD